MEKKSIIVQNLSLNTDLPQCDLPDNVLTQAINFTISNTKLVATKKSVPAPVDSIKGPWPSIPIEAVNIVFGQTNGQYYFLVSGVDGDFVFDGSNFINVTSADKTAGSINSQDKNLWTTCKLGFNVVINNSEFFPEYWSGQFGDSISPLKFSPTATFKSKNIKCKAMRSHKNFLFALNLVEQGVEYPYSYRWSHPADENGMPFSWDELDLSTLASKESVGGDYGVIVDGLSLRDSFCIYTERAIHVLDYTGDEFVFRRRLLTSSYGCISQNCVVEAENLHYIITPSDIVVNDGTSVQSLLTNTLKNVFSGISQLHYRNSYAVVNPTKTEIWFCFPEGNYVFPSLAIVYNYVTKQFGLTRLASAATHEVVGTMSSICFGIVLPSAYPWDELDGYFVDWDSWTLPVDSLQAFTGIGIDEEPVIPPADPNDIVYTDTWDNANASALKTDLFCVGPTMDSIEQMAGRRDYSTSSEHDLGYIVTVFEKTNWALDGHILVKTLTRIYPHITPTGGGIAKLYVGAHDYNGSDVRWNEPIRFDPKLDRKIDVRATGELLAIRFEFRGFTEVLFYGFTVEYTSNGVR